MLFGAANIILYGFQNIIITFYENGLEKEVCKAIIIPPERIDCDVVGLIQDDHAHLLIKVLPKILILNLMGILKGKSAITVFAQFPDLNERPYRVIIFGLQGIV